MVTNLYATGSPKKTEEEDAQKKLYAGIERKQVAGKNGLQTAYFCTLCKADCNSEQMLQSHVAGKKHQMNLAKKHGGGFGKIPLPTTSPASGPFIPILCFKGAGFCGAALYML